MLEQALWTLGRTLTDRGLRFHIAIVGGAALLLAEPAARPTRDVDVVAVASGGQPLQSRHQLPAELREAAEDVAAVLGLDRDWLIAGALGVLSGRLPHGYEQRLQSTSYGGLTVSRLARGDLIRLKLLAAADEGPGGVHLYDLTRMSVTAQELDDAKGWVASQYPPGPVPELDDVVAVLARQLQ